MKMDMLSGFSFISCGDRLLHCPSQVPGQNSLSHFFKMFGKAKALFELWHWS
jgi:hypothetical protein